jgi:hypothetical protein
MSHSVMSFAPRRRTIWSSRIAPATARSARRGSSPGTRSRSSRSIRDQVFSHPAELFRRNAPIPQRRRGCLAVRGGDNRAEAQDRSRGADHAVESGTGNLVEILADLLVDVTNQLAFVAPFQWIGFDKPLGQGGSRRA